ncbi:MAG TPA: hypothetical protein VNG53_02985 [Bacteroidia bacterium]|nr:hypothetical protein [Bacteroidia bacterium]
MKKLVIIIFLFLNLFGFSQTPFFTFPTIPKSADSLKNFVPTNWKILDSIVPFNLTKENIKGFAMVIEANDSLSFNDTICFSDQPFYPKMLLIVFKQPNGKFTLSTISSKIFGQCNWGIGGSDPFNGISIKRDTLDVQFLDGGTQRNYTSYLFSYQKNNWYLVEAEGFGFEVGQDGSTTENLNLVTGVKESYQQSGIGDGKITNDTKINISIEPLIKIEDIDEENYTSIFHDEN